MRRELSSCRVSGYLTGNKEGEAMRLGGFRIVLMILTSWLVVIVLLIKLLIRVGIFLFYVAEAMVVVPYRIVRMITCAVQGRKYA